MRVISKPILREFWARHPNAEGRLRAWYQEAKAADWTGPIDVKNTYPSASFLGDNRVVFNIGGTNTDS